MFDLHDKYPMIKSNYPQRKPVQKFIRFPFMCYTLQFITYHLPSTEIKQKSYRVLLTDIDARNGYAEDFFPNYQLVDIFHCMRTKFHVIVVRHAETFTLLSVNFVRMKTVTEVKANKVTA